MSELDEEKIKSLIRETIGRISIKDMIENYRLYGDAGLVIDSGRKKSNNRKK